MARQIPESPALMPARREARFVAFAVDALVLALLVVPFLALAGLTVLLQSAWLEVDPTLGEWLIGAAVVGVWLAVPPLYAVLGALSSGTVGARLLRLSITDEEGGELDTDRAVKRALLLYPSTWVLGLGHAMAFWDPLGRGLHDRVAGTIVVERARDKRQA
jgi:uncharacterized RDD family membrane protein YckC